MEKEYDGFVDKNIETANPLSRPYEYDFEHGRTDFDYDPPYPEADYRKINFLNSGTMITVSSGFVREIYIKTEEIYDRFE